MGFSDLIIGEEWHKKQKLAKSQLSSLILKKLAIFN
tara:strand:- start:17897 stop:18004 length:108 start_codon:yes stop_codon:yes gene_type:complete